MNKKTLSKISLLSAALLFGSSPLFAGSALRQLGLSSKTDITPLILKIQHLRTKKRSKATVPTPAEAMAIIEEARELPFKTPVEWKVLGDEDFDREFGGDSGGILGFYDPTSKKLVVRAGLDPVYGRGVILHEIVHALQDQYFDLTAIHNAVRTTEDYYLQKAVIEGDATLTFITAMPDSHAARMLKAPKPWLQVPGGPAPIFDGSRQGAAAKTLNLFDYSIAAVFVKAVKERQGWTGVDALFRTLPASTEQLLHPEKYFAGELPRQVSLPDISTELGATLKSKDRAGEFGLLLELLATPAGPLAEEAAAGWDNDERHRYVMGGAEFTIHKSWWDTSDDARQFYAAIDTAYPFPGSRVRAVLLNPSERSVIVCYDMPQALTVRAFQALARP